MVGISVIVPVYNVENYLEEALNSILNQTFTDIEVLCINDGSKDNSLDILYDFQRKDERIKVIDKENGGCGSARNKGLDLAKGKYIYFFDPDDKTKPEALEKLYDNAESNNSDLVMFKLATFMDGHEVDYSHPAYNFDELFKGKDFNNFSFNRNDIKHYVLNSSFAPWLKLYKKEFLDRYDDFRFVLGLAFDDVPFHVMSLVRAKRISFVPDYLYFYRLSNPTSVNNTKSNQIDIFKIIDIVEGFLRSEGVFDEFEYEFTKFKIEHILRYVLSTNSIEYFNLAKDQFKNLNVKSIPRDSDLLGRYNLLLDSDSYFDYQQNLLFYNNRMNRKYHIINTSPSFYAKKAYKKLFK